MAETRAEGRAIEERGPRASRNQLQTVTLLDAIAEHGFDAAFGGARRDEERARAKERIREARLAEANRQAGTRTPPRRRPPPGQPRPVRPQPAPPEPANKGEGEGT